MPTYGAGLKAIYQSLCIYFDDNLKCAHVSQVLEALGGPKALMKCLQLLRASPVVAAFGERPLSLLALLQASPYLSSLGKKTHLTSSAAHLVRTCP